MRIRTLFVFQCISIMAISKNYINTCVCWLLFGMIFEYVFFFFFTLNPTLFSKSSTRFNFSSDSFNKALNYAIFQKFFLFDKYRFFIEFSFSSRVAFLLHKYVLNLFLFGRTATAKPYRRLYRLEYFCCVYIDVTAHAIDVS